jgi:hypothetical protein
MDPGMATNLNYATLANEALANAEPTVVDGKAERIAVLVTELNGINDLMQNWVAEMHAANREAFEKFCGDVIALRAEEFEGDLPGIGGLLVLAKANLLERLIEAEKRS